MKRDIYDGKKKEKELNSIKKFYNRLKARDADNNNDDDDGHPVHEVIVKREVAAITFH